jgi:transcriptional regulator NrdR family protein
MTEVIKKDGTKKPFDSEKIRKSIAGAAQQADIPEERKEEVVFQVAGTVIPMLEGKEEMDTSDIKQVILSELDRVEPAVASAWRKYEEGKSKA